MSETWRWGGKKRRALRMHANLRDQQLKLTMYTHRLVHMIANHKPKIYNG